jgi:hypothetical protein
MLRFLVCVQDFIPDLVLKIMKFCVFRLFIIKLSYKCFTFTHFLKLK